MLFLVYLIDLLLDVIVDFLLYLILDYLLCNGRNILLDFLLRLYLLTTDALLFFLFETFFFYETFLFLDPLIVQPLVLQLLQKGLLLFLLYFHFFYHDRLNILALCGLSRVLGDLFFLVLIQGVLTNRVESLSADGVASFIDGGGAGLEESGYLLHHGCGLSFGYFEDFACFVAHFGGWTEVNIVVGRHLIVLRYGRLIVRRLTTLEKWHCE